jgi:formate dehydrogenase iron-sulfur subunit
MSYAIFVDTTLCTGCRACQVACKQWHDLPAEETLNRGTFENPADLSFDTYRLVRMKEEMIDGKLHWLFFAEQCRHCLEAPCLEVAGDTGAVYRDEVTSAIVYTAATRHLFADEIIEACPYHVPRKGPGGVLVKCDMCNDRIHNGLQPACVKACPTGGMNFGPRDEMLSLAQKRLEEVGRRFPNAILADPDDVSVIYLVAHDPMLYGDNLIAARTFPGISRHMALKRMFRPFSRAASRLMSG